jgi:phosphoglycolate phosphatase-like HAD superfamily hydrolase
VVPTVAPPSPWPGPRPLLLLFDIDGTLLQRASVEHAVALREAAAEVHGLPALDGVVEAAGRTDLAIARDLLAAAGVTADRIDEELRAVADAAAETFGRLCPSDLSNRLAPGIFALLPRLASRPHAFQLSLVTGNLEPVARLKLSRAGVGGYFPEGQGAFGSDSENRDELPAIARSRAALPAWPRERTVVIGDTPLDIACARADGVRVVAVGTGPFGVEALADADAVVGDARALLPVLEDWVSAPA